jgi:hypothetical protein
MTKEQAEAIMNVLFIAYPNSYKNWKPVQHSLAPKLWANHFQNVPVELVMLAVDKYIDSDSPFAPSLGEIMTLVKDSISRYDADTAWAQVEWIVRNVPEGYSMRLKELDDITQRLIKSEDIRRFKEVEGAMEKAKYGFLQRYNKIRAEREDTAIKTGKLEMIADTSKYQRAISTADLRLIETKNGR